MRQSPCTYGKHVRQVWEAAEPPHDGAVPEDLLPWPRGLVAAASVRALLAKAPKPVVCWLVMLCGALNCLFLDKQYHKVPETEPSPLQVEALRHLHQDVTDFFRLMQKMEPDGAQIGCARSKAHRSSHCRTELAMKSRRE